MSVRVSASVSVSTCIAQFNTMGVGMPPRARSTWRRCGRKGGGRGVRAVRGCGGL